MLMTAPALPPAVAVRGFAQACQALAPGLPVTLLSGAQAGLRGGVGWWRGLVAAAAAAHPETTLHDILDCGDAPGAAMAALRGGQRLLVLDPAVPAFAAVQAAAATLGAAVLPARPPALDLSQGRSAVRRLADWLAG